MAIRTLTRPITGAVAPMRALSTAAFSPKQSAIREIYRRAPKDYVVQYNSLDDSSELVESQAVRTRGKHGGFCGSTHAAVKLEIERGVFEDTRNTIPFDEATQAAESGLKARLLHAEMWGSAKNDDGQAVLLYISSDTKPVMNDSRQYSFAEGPVYIEWAGIVAPEVKLASSSQVGRETRNLVEQKAHQRISNFAFRKLGSTVRY